jgi:hypothetical protein
VATVLSLTDRVNFYESIFGKGRLSSNGINFDVRCPVCAPNDASKKKLSIRTDNEANHCWVCGWKSRSIVPLLRKYGSQSQLDQYKQLFGVPGSSAQFLTGEKEEQEKIELPKDFQLLAMAPTIDPDVKAAWRYILNRGLTERDAWYFKFGVSSEPKWKRRVIMPSFDVGGNLNYFVARAVDKDKKPKYDNPHVDHRQVVFNEISIDWTQRLTIVEGPFDMIKCPENSTALLGSDFSEQHDLFGKILMHNTPVALAMDGDMWDTKMPKIVQKLQEYDVDVVVVDVRPWGDPGNMSRAEFEKALVDAKPLSWADKFSLKLQKALSKSYSF